ncbi:ribonuclease P protein component [Sphaerotilus sp.]|uniref:ribonuclease P protein component n=1 Tax=Sphaerotilus sp. TaxID=2093942 RepID=UPI0034E1FECA
MVLTPLTGAARFESAMAVRPIARSAHFMVHHLATTKLSTGHNLALTASGAVDDSVNNSVDDRPETSALRLGLVVPKRHARRSVTRTQVKTQIRAGIRRHLDQLVAGDWVVRLRAPLDRKLFPSARSEALAALLHVEIEALLSDAARRARRALVPTAPAKAI